MKNKMLYLNSALAGVFFFSYVALGNPETYENLKEDYHRHLPQDIPEMMPNSDPETSVEYRHIVNDQIFDQLHPMRRFEDKGFSEISCQVHCENGNVGSGTVVSIKKGIGSENESLVFTAKHVVHTKGVTYFPEVYQGLTTFEDNTSNYLAKHQVYEVCFNQKKKNLDIALLKGKVIEDNLKDDSLLQFSARIRSRADSGKTSPEEGYMNHYPLGDFTQRFNMGWVYANGSHTLRGLPGSSGAGIFNSRGCLSWIHVSGGKPLSHKVFYDVTFLRDMPVKAKILNISERNLSYPLYEEDLTDFTDCVKRSALYNKK